VSVLLFSCYCNLTHRHGRRRGKQLCCYVKWYVMLYLLQHKTIYYVHENEKALLPLSSYSLSVVLWKCLISAPVMLLLLNIVNVHVDILLTITLYYNTMLVYMYIKPSGTGHVCMSRVTVSPESRDATYCTSMLSPYYCLCIYIIIYYSKCYWLWNI